MQSRTILSGTVAKHWMTTPTPRENWDSGAEGGSECDYVCVCSYHSYRGCVWGASHVWMHLSCVLDDT